MFSPLKISDNLHIIQRSNQPHVAYHKQFGNLTTINDSSLQLLNLFQKTLSIETWQVIYNTYHYYIEAFKNMYYLVENDVEEKTIVKNDLEERAKKLKTGFYIGGVQLSVSDECNFKCNYCFCDFVDQRNGKRTELHKRKDKLMNFENCK